VRGRIPHGSHRLWTPNSIAEISPQNVFLMKLAQSKIEAEALTNLSSSWSRLAGQIERYNVLMREQGRCVRGA
jgi:hypothetical protein